VKEKGEAPLLAKGALKQLVGAGVGWARPAAGSPGPCTPPRWPNALHAARKPQTCARARTRPGCCLRSPALPHPARPACHAQIFISKDHEKGAFGEWSPGPVTGQVVNSFGKQTMSVKKSNPSWGFGTSKVGRVRMGVGGLGTPGICC